MKIVTTPMCQEILHLAGASKFSVAKDGIYGDADIAVVLSETKIPESSHAEVIRLKLNTFSQINDSIKLVSSALGTKPLEEETKIRLKNISNDENRKIRVKTYTNFLREITEDMGFSVVTDDSYDYLIYPDYMKEKLKEDLNEADERAVELPSHQNAPLNPIERAEIRYQILENRICTKH